jgi:hypothetical protein
LAPLLEDAADAGSRKPHGPIGEYGRGKGFHRLGPNRQHGLGPEALAVRRPAHRASLLIEQAELTLEEASGVIANGYLRLDPREWIRAVEKRRAALGR